MRTTLAAAALLAASVAVAAPVPKAPPPPNPKSTANLYLASAKMSGANIELTQTQQSARARMVTETVEVNGVPTQVTKQIIEYTPTQVTMQMTTAGMKVTTADGKEVAADDIAKKIGDGAAVVRVIGTLDPEWRKMFADDVLFLEQGGAAGFVGRPGVVRVAPPVLVPPPGIEK